MTVGLLILHAPIRNIIESRMAHATFKSITESRMLHSEILVESRDDSSILFGVLFAAQHQ